ncbi:(2Fe-2S) ferredoxin domain-containing protein [Almyronema epifaneia]|uniref:Ferredoxin n=1 Tax=Almyronema epifaneia S1 TaxID=2991925 RepID=A0ABW6ICJ7_9CYAN
MSKRDRKTDFFLEGRFLGFSPQGTTDNKYIDLLTAQGGYRIKLRKSLRPILADYLLPGDAIRVIGEQKGDETAESSQMKALKVTRLAPDQIAVAVQPSETQAIASAKSATPNSPKPTKILVCQKSSCRKRGSAEVCQQLTESLEKSGLSDRVTIKKTGCMGHCKSGPHVVFIPDKKRYSGVKPKAVPELVAKHCAQKTQTGDRQS